MSDQPAEFGLVMPFIVCAPDGPYDGASFVAGYQCAFIDARLASGELWVKEYVASGIVAQLDLLAMRHGYSLKSEPWDEHPEEWTLVELTRVGER